MNLETLYRKYYKKLLYVPVAIFFVYIYLAFFYPGIKLGIDFSGGVLVSFASDSPFDAEALASAIKQATGAADVRVTPTLSIEGGKTVYGGIVEVAYPERKEMGAKTETEITQEENKSNLQAIVLSVVRREVPGARDIVIREVTPTLGARFWNTALWIAVWAVILLTLTVVFFFRQPTPTMIMIGSAIFDLLGMLALMALFNIPLTLETMTILLMQVGYSIDTDIVLATHLLKRREGAPEARAARAARTGIHMTGTTFVAMIFVYAVGYLTRNLTVMRIANVMFFGLISDLFVTWLMNASVLLMWVKRHASPA